MKNESVSKKGSLEEVSVLLTNFNKGHFLNNILVISSELLSKGAELVIVDDGSTDGSYQKISEFFKGKESIILVSQSNQGSAASRNRAIHLSTRRFLVFLDFDDSLSVTILEEGVKELRNSEAKVGILNYEIEPGKNKSVMPVSVEKPKLMSLSNYRNEFFQTMGYWRYLYSKDFILECNIQFSPSFKEVGGLFILDDLFWLLHTLSIDMDVLVFPDDAILYIYNTVISSQSDRLKYQRQVMLFPKAMSIFVSKLADCRHPHDVGWLEEILPKVTTQHLNFLTLTQLIRTLPSYFSMMNSSDLFSVGVSRTARTKEIRDLFFRSLKNSLLRSPIFFAVVKRLKNA